MLDYNQLLEFAGITGPDVPERFHDCFDEAMRRMPDRLPWLTPEFTRESADYYNLGEKDCALYFTAAERVAADVRLQQLFWLYYYILYEGQQQRFPTWSWPFPEGTVPLLESRFFPNLVLLSGSAVQKRTFATARLPLTILEKQKKNVSHDALETFDESTGIMGTVALLQKGLQVRLGRLVYEFGVSEIDNFMLLRSAKTGELVIVATEGRYTPGGFFPCDWDNPDAEEGFNVKFEITADRYIAHPVHPDGYVMPEAVAFMYDEWAAPFDMPCEVACIHIPGKEPFTQETILQSFAELHVFLDKYAPDFRPRYLYTDTWLLSPQFDDCHGKDSNISNFKRFFYRFPNSTDLGSVLMFLFGDEKIEDYNLLKEDTSLQRSVKQKLLRGERVETSCGLILLDDWYKLPGQYHQQSFFASRT